VAVAQAPAGLRFYKTKECMIKNIYILKSLNAKVCSGALIGFIPIFYQPLMLYLNMPQCRNG